MQGEGENQSFYETKVGAACSCSPSTVKNALSAAVEQGSVEFVEKNGSKRYSLTDDGRKAIANTLPCFNWGGAKAKTPS